MWYSEASLPPVTAPRQELQESGGVEGWKGGKCSMKLGGERSPHTALPWKPMEKLELLRDTLGFATLGGIQLLLSVFSTR